MARVWAITTNKGGVLKTSLTTNIAGVLCKTQRVLIVDTDNQGNCLSTFGQNPDEVKITLYDVLAEGLPAESAIVNVHENIDVLVSNDDMSLLEFNMMQSPHKYPQPFQMLKTALDPIRENYDVIIVDTPPHMGVIQGNVLTFVDDVIIPFQPALFSRRSLVRMVDTVQDFKSKHNPRLSILGLVATLVESRTKVQADILADCRKFCEENHLRLLNTSIPRSIRFESTVSYDRLPATLARGPKIPAVQRYFDLVEEVQST